ncbi:MAG: hypothetical protein ACR2QF_04845 [Geminicoccaceae bacterium]
MPKVTPLQTSFNAGEISQRAMLRTDIDRYYKSADKAENLLVQTQGGITRRPGTRLIAETKQQTAPGDVRLIPFEFNAEQAYTLEVGQGYIRFFTRQAPLLGPGVVPLEVATPYVNFDPYLLRWAQSADTLRLVHPQFEPQILSRFSEQNWTIAPTPFINGPFLPLNTTNTTISANGTTGVVTLTATAPIWQAGHVGAFWRLGNPSGTITAETWAPGQVVAIGNGRQFDGKFYRAATAGTTGQIAPTHDEGVVSDGLVDWTFAHNGFSHVKILTFISPTQVTAQVQGTGQLVNLLTNGTRYWNEGAWSTIEGYPSTVTFFEQRTVYAGSTGSPKTIWMSRTGDFDNFELPGLLQDTQDDDPIEATLDSDQEDSILWTLSRDRLLVGTSGGEYRVGGVGGAAVTPRNLDAKKVTSTRAGNIDPIFARSSVLFLSRGREKMHELVFDFNSDNFETPDLTKIADHMLISGVTQAAYQQDPENIIWCCLENGGLVSLGYDRVENVIAWTRHPMPGRTVSSVMTLPGSQSGNSEQRDELWMVVRSGNINRVEIMEPFWRGVNYGDVLADAYYVDSGVRYDGPATSTIDGLGHLEGQTVNALVDGRNLGQFTVTGGQVTFPVAGTKANVGLPINYFFKSVKIEGGSPIGTAIGKKRVISEVAISLLDSCEVRCGTVRAELEPVEFFDDQTVLLNGDYRVNCAHTWQQDRDPRIYVEGDGPCPMTMLALGPRQRTEDA